MYNPITQFNKSFFSVTCALRIPYHFVACSCIFRILSSSFSLVSCSRRLSTLMGKQKGVNVLGRMMVILPWTIRSNVAYRRSISSYCDRDSWWACCSNRLPGSCSCSTL
jgi:hypothetical protein